MLAAQAEGGAGLSSERCDDSRSKDSAQQVGVDTGANGTGLEPSTRLLAAGAEAHLKVSLELAAADDAPSAP